MAAPAWAAVLGQTLRDALAFDRPGRILQRDPYTGAITGAIGARAPLPAVDPALAAAFPGRSPRELLGALERGRGVLYEQLREYGRAAPRAPLPAGPGPRPGPGARLGAAGLWDCERTRPVYYRCIADGARLQRSPWGRLPVNPLPRGFGQTLRRLIRGGLRPRDAMREAWAWARNPGTRWHGGEATRAEAARYASEERGRVLGAHYYRGKRDAHRESQAESRRLGLNPGAAWHERLEEAARERADRRGGHARAFWLGHADAQEWSAVESRRLGLNPQVAFDPFDYDSPAAAKKARDALYRQLRAAGHRPRRSVLRGQLEKYRGLGVEGRGVRDVFYVTWEDPTLPSEARVFGYRQGNIARPSAIPADKLAAASRYLNLVRNRAKRAYGFAYLSWLKGGAIGHPPERPRGLSVIGAQAVRLQLEGMGLWGNPRRPSRARYCPEQVAPKARFDPRSFRTVASDGHRVTVGCPQGKWDPRRKRCKVGTQAQRILHPEGEGVCPLPPAKVRRRRNPLTRGETRTVLQSARSAWHRARELARPWKDYQAGRGDAYTAVAHVYGQARRGRIGRVNPPAGPVEVYRRVEFIGATKGPGSRHAGERFLHRFRTPARMLGLPDGSLLIQAARGR